MIFTSVELAALIARREYSASGVTAMGTPEIVHVFGDRTSPKGRLVLDNKMHDVIVVPPVQEGVIG